MEQPVTIVLPMHNQVQVIRTTVLEVLEVTELVSAGIELVVVDDGSTDDTFEIACELARTFPQVHVLRQASRKGLGAARDAVREWGCGKQLVLMHDGASPIDAEELKHLLRLGATPNELGDGNPWETHGSRRFATGAEVQHTVHRQHRRVGGFTWMRLEHPLVPRRRTTASTPRTSSLRTDRGRPIANYLTTLPTGIPGPVPVQ